MMNKKKIDLIEVALWIGIVIAINIIAAQFFFRIDLTDDKRYTISDTSKEILRKLDDVVYVEVYLGGDLSGDYKRLEKSVKEMLEELKVYAGNNIQYSFFDPNKEEDETKRSRIFEYLRSKGINPIEIQTKDGVKYIFPAAQIVYREKEKPVLLINSGAGNSEADMINNSVEGLEFQLISSIRELTLKNKKSVAFIEGHGELDAMQTLDMFNTLSGFYNVYRINLNAVKSLENYDALIVAGPQSKFSEPEKYALDQYIIKGGKVLFLLDPVIVNMDSIGSQSGTVAVPIDHNLDDLLFKYGLRINNNLIQDMQSMTIPMYVGEIQGKPQMRNVPWRYYPLLNNFTEHPSVKNIDLVLSKFIGTIDTVKAAGVNKTPLIYTSKYTKAYNAPLNIDLNDARKNVTPEDFNLGELPVAFLLEGQFSSLYKNRPLPVKDSAFVSDGKKSQIFVMSDADIIKNVQEKKGQQVRQMPLPGGNKALISNVVDYMLDESGLVNVRAKEIELRPLDKVKVRDEKLYWQVINLVIPVFLIIGFGVAMYYWRKKKYSSF